MLQNGGEISEGRRYKEERIWQGDTWLIATLAGQVVIVEEELDLPSWFG
jgi:hypothetical protein